jgi:RNA polymerase sigma-70 factor, ECF subfamily
LFPNSNGQAAATTVADSSPKLERPKPKPARRGAASASPRVPLASGSDGAVTELPVTAAEKSTQPPTDLPQSTSPQDAVTQPCAAADITQLVIDHHEVLYRYAYRLTGSVADAEDLTQQTFLVAHEKLGQVREAGSVRSWLFTVLRNGYLKNRRRTLPLTAGTLGLDLDTVLDKNTVAARADESPIDPEQLQRTLNELADEFKLVLLLFYFEERSYREIAEILQVPPGTVMSRLSRAKAHLRSKLFSTDREATHAGKVVP